MQATYVNADNHTTGGVAIGPSGQNIEILKLIIGAPTSSKNVYLYDETNVGNVTNTTGLKMLYTFPSSVATSQVPVVVDLTDNQGHGLILSSGGSLATDAALQVTVLWQNARPGEEV